jgi:hypothetical protein
MHALGCYTHVMTSSSSGSRGSILFHFMSCPLLHYVKLLHHTWWQHVVYTSHSAYSSGCHRIVQVGQAAAAT